MPSKHSHLDTMNESSTDIQHLIMNATSTAEIIEQVKGWQRVQQNMVEQDDAYPITIIDNFLSPILTILESSGQPVDTGSMQEIEMKILAPVDDCTTLPSEDLITTCLILEAMILRHQQLNQRHVSKESHGILDRDNQSCKLYLDIVYNNSIMNLFFGDFHVIEETLQREIVTSFRQLLQLFLMSLKDNKAIATTKIYCDKLREYFFRSVTNLNDNMVKDGTMTNERINLDGMHKILMSLAAVGARHEHQKSYLRKEASALLETLSHTPDHRTSSGRATTLLWNTYIDLCDHYDSIKNSREPSHRHKELQIIVERLQDIEPCYHSATKLLRFTQQPHQQVAYTIQPTDLRELDDILPLLTLCYNKAYNIIKDETIKEVDLTQASVSKKSILEENLKTMVENLEIATQYFLSYYEQSIKDASTLSDLLTIMSDVISRLVPGPVETRVWHKVFNDDAICILIQTELSSMLEHGHAIKILCEYTNLKAYHHDRLTDIMKFNSKKNLLHTRHEFQIFATASQLLFRVLFLASPCHAKEDYASLAAPFSILFLSVLIHLDLSIDTFNESMFTKVIRYFKKDASEIVLHARSFSHDLFTITEPSFILSPPIDPLDNEKMTTALRLNETLLSLLDFDNEKQKKVAKKIILTIINLLSKMKNSTRIDDFTNLLIESDIDASIPVSELLLIADTALPTCYRIITHYPEELKLEKDKYLSAINDRIFKLIPTCSKSYFCELLDEILHLSEDKTTCSFRMVIDYLYSEAYKTDNTMAQSFLSTALEKLKSTPNIPIDLQSFLHDRTLSPDDRQQSVIDLFEQDKKVEPKKTKKKKKKKMKQAKHKPSHDTPSGKSTNNKTASHEQLGVLYELEKSTLSQRTASKKNKGEESNRQSSSPKSTLGWTYGAKPPPETSSCKATAASSSPRSLSSNDSSLTTQPDFVEQLSSLHVSPDTAEHPDMNNQDKTPVATSTAEQSTPNEPTATVTANAMNSAPSQVVTDDSDPDERATHSETLQLTSQAALPLAQHPHHAAGLPGPDYHTAQYISPGQLYPLPPFAVHFAVSCIHATKNPEQAPVSFAHIVTILSLKENNKMYRIKVKKEQLMMLFPFTTRDIFIYSKEYTQFKPTFWATGTKSPSTEKLKKADKLLLTNFSEDNIDLDTNRHHLLKAGDMVTVNRVPTHDGLPNCCKISIR